MGWGSFTKSFTKPFKQAVSVAKKTITAPTDLAKKAVGTVAGAALGGAPAVGGGSNTTTSTSVTPITNITNKTDLDPLAAALQDSKGAALNLDLKGTGSNPAPVVVNVSGGNTTQYIAAAAAVAAAYFIYKKKKGK